MIVVSDTTPLNYLILIGAQEVLSRLFGQVHVPPAVIEEMKHPKAEAGVRRWAETPPEWIKVQAHVHLDPRLPPKLHRGEIHAISLALELRAAWVLIDDWDARQAAKAMGLPLSGTRNVLEEAAYRDMIDINEAIERLKLTNYRATEAQYQATIENVLVRKQAP